MGKILPGYKTSIINDLINSIASNTHIYYSFASSPIPNSGNVAPVLSDDYDNIFLTSWQLMFGKKLSSHDIVPVIVNNKWQTNTVYSRYDNTANTYAEDNGTYANTNYYVIVPPGTYGGGYNVYVCIDNNQGNPSIYAPSQIQPSTFETSDKYKWRYITTISSSDYLKFSTDKVAPIYANSLLSASAFSYAGVDTLVITNSGNGYSTYHDGTIRSVVNTTLIQIDSSDSNALNPPSTDNDFYTNSGIYIYNSENATSQYFGISKYVSNTVGTIRTNWIYLDNQANTDTIIPNITNYKISPKIRFQTDATHSPVAYSVINTTSNSISNIVIVDPGSGVTWANVIVESNTSYPTLTSGNRANVYAIVPPAGGHGYDPVTALKATGVSISFTFANNEFYNIPVNCTYNRIGILKDPFTMSTNTNNSNSTFINKTEYRYTNTYFNQVTIANVDPIGTVFNVGETITGSVSNALGIVVFSNTTQIGFTGDKHFAQTEPIVSANGTKTANININTFGNIYVKDLDIIYVQNLTDVSRSNTQSENYKLVIQI